MEQQFYSDFLPETQDPHPVTKGLLMPLVTGPEKSEKPAESGEMGHYLNMAITA